MSIRLYSAQSIFSVVSALICSVVMINIATSAFPLA